jgi:hypothetical protein
MTLFCCLIKKRLAKQLSILKRKATRNLGPYHSDGEGDVLVGTLQGESTSFRKIEIGEVNDIGVDKTEHRKVKNSKSLPSIPLPLNAKPKR